MADKRSFGTNHGNQNPDIIVIGGGVVGMLSALQFKKSGATVTIIERDRLGMESSWAGGGILSTLSPWADDKPMRAMTKQSISYYTELNQWAKQVYPHIDLGLYQSGMLVLPPLPKDIPNHLKTSAATADLQQLAPSIQANDTSHLWFPHIYQIRNTRMIKLLRALLTEQGITILEQHTMHDIIVKEKKCLGVVTDYGKHHSQKVVICAGAWSGDLIAQKTKKPQKKNIIPIRGEMLLYQADPASLKTILLQDGYYLIPRYDGKILAGSTVTVSQFDKRPSNTGYTTLSNQAESMLPALNTCAVKMQWVGLRPKTIDELPLIGAVPDIKGLYCNSGHFRHGILLAPASALIIDHILCERKQNLPFWVEKLTPTRFY